jgi:alpha-amylase
VIEDMIKLIRALLLMLASCAVSAFAQGKPAATAGTFADNPIVYFVVTDRFLDGNPANNNSYGREREKDPKKDIGTFHGGDLAGLTKKLKEGYFKALGVNAIWITAPYEQMHGWVVGGNKEFRHYGYHGYYALDFTKLDANMGTEAELREMVDTAHAQGIRVLFDIVMNHPGYGDIKSLSKFVGPRGEKKTGVLWKGYEEAWLNDYHSFIDYNDPAWLNWWGPDWIRSGLRGYQEGGRDDLTGQLAYLPDFKTEATKKVGLPPFLKNKPDTKAKELPDATVRDYLVTWLTQWVADFGIDGFRADTVKHVEPESWAALKKSSVQALANWRKANPGKSPDDAPFWMTGEYWGQGIERTKLYDAGFDNLINFDFQSKLEEVKTNADLDKLYADYAKTLAAPATHNVLSYISSHDTKLFERAKLADASTALMLAPGGVQIYYGDETARSAGPFTPGDKQQATRSFMNWDSIDAGLLDHWKKLGQFRARHVAVAKGAHSKLADAPYTFSRTHTQDKVVIAIGAKEGTPIKVGGVFAEGTELRDAYTGTTAKVAAGSVQIKPDTRGVVLLEQVAQ